MAEPTVLEPAIAPHLRRLRTLPAKTPPNYQPPFPAYSARFPEKAKGLVIAIIGLQSQSPSSEAFTAGRNKLHMFFTRTTSQNQSSHDPRYWTIATVTDNSGYFNASIISYWQTRPDYEEWVRESGLEKWWTSLAPGENNIGWFREVFLPTLERFETVFSDDTMPEGAAHMREGNSGQIREHGYWGSMRDRFAIGQTDPLDPSKNAQTSGEYEASDTRSRRIKVPGRHNLAVIRSGQDWSDTTPRERKLYLDTMHPVLIKGMDFLRDEGGQVGCFSCRLMDAVEPDAIDSSSPSGKTFGLAYFDNLTSLEKWSKEHKTHLNIFGRFLQYAGELQGEMSLRLFHEVFVLEPEQQKCEYVGCHKDTGMLASL